MTESPVQMFHAPMSSPDAAEDARATTLDPSAGQGGSMGAVNLTTGFAGSFDGRIGPDAPRSATVPAVFS
jgi:hypothetical protein